MVRTVAIRIKQSSPNIPDSIPYKSIAGRYRPFSYPDGAITARYRFIKNAYWDIFDTSAISISVRV